MKKLTPAEMSDRIKAVNRSAHLFRSMKDQTCPHCGKKFVAALNITETFEAYQEILAEQERDKFITAVSIPVSETSELHGFDQSKRPDCPKCGKKMVLLTNIADLDEKNNPAGWKSAWMCPDSFAEEEECWHIEYSKKTIHDWREEFSVNLLKDE
jgi:hypothetical protein